ncbi:MAG: FHA domain-containing protein, partial [Candidatus Eremiobacteraeota bacterium]|nr:FHA domain-containing protein [Candidatus Eremiobacteraeota bacterium]
VRDLGSTNGTYVNGERVEARPLRDGDELTFGNTRMRFEAS